MTDREKAIAEGGKAFAFMFDNAQQVKDLVKQKPQGPYTAEELEMVKGAVFACKDFCLWGSDFLGELREVLEGSPLNLGAFCDVDSGDLEALSSTFEEAETALDSFGEANQ